MSRPRAAMSVATRTRSFPSLNFRRLSCRAVWDLLPWMAAAATPAGQVPGHFVRPVLGPGEHQGAFHLLLLQNLQQQGGFVLPIHQADLLADDLHRGGHRGGGHLHRVMEEGVHQV